MNDEGGKRKEQVVDRCENCRHFVIVKDAQGAGHGQCRSGPPTLVVQVVTQSRIVGTRCGPQTGMALLSAWPPVTPDLWCGAFGHIAEEPAAVQGGGMRDEG